MSQRRGIVTDQLTNVIQVIQLGKKTGRLNVERGDGAQREDGVLLFVRGQITDAYCGHLYAHAALERLRMWGACRFIFDSADSERTGTTGPMPQLSPAPATTPRSTQDQNYRNPTTHSLAGQFSIPQTPNGSTDPYISGKFPAISTPPPSSPPGSPTPYRIKQDAVGMHLLNQGGFSRLHLRLYLLIDGQRNIFELIRLMRRPAEEIQQLLHDLRHLGVIYY